MLEQSAGTPPGTVADQAKGPYEGGGISAPRCCAKMVESLGGRLEAFSFTFGENDILVILDLPENLTAATLSLAVMSTGVVRTKTKVLLTPEEIDRAVKTPVDFQQPGYRTGERLNRAFPGQTYGC
jgi:hypothetical protein